MAQITVASALGLEARVADLHWRRGRPALADWFGCVSARLSLRATVPA